MYVRREKTHACPLPDPTQQAVEKKSLKQRVRVQKDAVMRTLEEGASWVVH